jgi:hypothetical protein
MGFVEKIWASKVGLMKLFEIKWTTPHHDFSTPSRTKKTIYVRIGEKVIVVNRHVITYVFKISNTR